MAISTSPRFVLLLSTILLCYSSATAIDEQVPSFAPIPPLTSSSSPHEELQNQQTFFSNIALLPQILTQLGYHELAAASPSLSDKSPSAWIGPFTLFAPTDAALHTCLSCSVPNVLREHIVPGLFTIDYLRNLPFGTKIETLSPGRCITVTSERSSSTSSDQSKESSSIKIFIGGLEITQPDLYNNGVVVVHGLQSFISPLSPLSCDVERTSTTTTLTFNGGAGAVGQDQRLHPWIIKPLITRLMLKDAMLRLRNNGYGILALAMKIKYAELVTLSNMTIFALDDFSIFSGSQSYISNIRFHIVPNIYLTFADLEKLPLGTPLPTLVQGQTLVITTTGGGGSTTAPMRINYVRIKVPEVIRNLKIIVHGLFLPFPHIHPAAAMYDEILGGGSGGSDMESNHVINDRTVEDAAAAAAGTCYPLFGEGACVHQVAMPPFNKPTVEIEDHHGL